ncbi:MAG TPA: TlpA disulfide reductase family protein [Rhodoblastus sp.]|nr:TlpA disulfide reductase family protein [Rhodoblastus sp.]
MIRVALALLLALAAGPAPAVEFKASTPTPMVFAVRDRDGGVHAGAELRARITLVHFWATWCLPCREELPALKSLQDDMRGAGVRVAAISIDRLGWGAIDRTIAALDVGGLAIYHDLDREAAKALRVETLPTTILMDADGQEIARLNGQGDWRDPALRRAILARAGK